MPPRADARTTHGTRARALPVGVNGPSAGGGKFGKGTASGMAYDTATPGPALTATGYSGGAYQREMTTVRACGGSCFRQRENEKADGLTRTTHARMRTRARAQVYEIVTDAAGVAQYAQPLLQFQYGLNGSVTTPCLVDGAGAAGSATLNPAVAVACSAGQMNWKGYQFPGLITDHSKTAKDTSVAGKWQASGARINHASRGASGAPACACAFARACENPARGGGVGLR